MKKIFVFAAVALLACGCQNGTKKADLTNAPQAEQPAEGKKGAIAYVELDSFATQYQFCVDQQKELEKKQASYEQQLKSKETELNNLSNTIQQNLQNGKYKSEQEYNTAMQNGQKKAQAYEQLQQRLSNELAQATADYQVELKKRIDTFLKEYNKDGRFAMILTNSATTMNLLYADSTLDITSEIIDGLNKEYKK